MTQVYFRCSKSATTFGDELFVVPFAFVLGN